MHDHHRYPGIRPFTLNDRNLFFGRDEDIDDLCQMIYLERLVVLYGKSGLGKTSLLNAGVVPKLQKDMDLTPYMIRFGSDMEGKQLSPLQILKERLSQDLSTDNYLGEIIPNPDSLWYYFKHLQIQNGKDKTYLLVFDQFEELFTYSEQAIYEFKREIAAITNNNLPKSFKAKLRKILGTGVENQNLSEDQLNFLYQPLNVKIVMAIRSDRMSMLDKFKDYLPDILQKTYELEPLSIGQAKMAIIEPACAEGNFSTPPFTYDPMALRKILRYLSNDNTQKVESFQLQIICQNMEEYATMNKVDNIALSDVGDLNQVIKNYYDHQIELIGTSEEQLATRILIEEGMIFEPEQRRLSLYEGQIYQNYNISEELLSRLVHARLLRAEPNTAGGFSYELCHDTLVGPILKAKNKRLEERRKEEERLAKLEAEKQERLQRAKVRRRYFTILGFVALLGLMSFGIAVWLSQRNAILAESYNKIESQNKEIAATLAALEEKETQLQKEKQAAILAKDEAELRRIEAEEAKIEAERAKQLALLANTDLEKAKLTLEKELDAKAGESDRIRSLMAEYWFNPTDMGDEDFNYALQTLVPLMREDTTLGSNVLNSFRLAEEAKNIGNIKFQYHLAKRARELKSDNRIATAILDSLTKSVLLPNQSYELPVKSTIKSFKLTPNKETLVVGGDQYIHFYDANQIGIPYEVNVSQYSPIKSIIFSTDGQLMATLHEYSFEAHIWDISNENKLPKEPSFSISDSSYISSLAFSPDKTTIAVGNEGGHVNLFNRAGKFLENFVSKTGYSKTISQLEYHSDGSKLLILSGSQAAIYNTRDKSVYQDLDYAHYIHPHAGSHVFTVDYQTVNIYQQSDEEYNFSKRKYQLTQDYYFPERIERVVFTDNQKHILAIGYNLAFLVDYDTGERKRLFSMNDPLVDVQLAKNGHILLGHQSGKITHWDINYPIAFEENKLEEISPLEIQEAYQNKLVTFDEVLESGTEAEKDKLAQYFIDQYDFEKAQQLSPTNVDVLFESGKQHYFSSNYELAIESLIKANDIRPKHYETLNYLANSYYNLYRYKEALVYFEQEAEYFPDKANGYNVGLCLLWLGNYTESESILLSILEKEPKNADVLNGLGIIYKDLKQYDKAETYLKKAIETNAYLYFPYANLGRTYLGKATEAESAGQTAEKDSLLGIAIDYLEQYKAKVPSATAWIYELATYYEQANNYKSAMDNYNFIIDRNDNYLDAYTGLSRVNIADSTLISFEEVISHFDDYIQRAPSDVLGYFKRGLLFHDNGIYDRAILDYNKAIDIEPAYYLARANRGLCYEIRGDYDKALADYEVAKQTKIKETSHMTSNQQAIQLEWVLEAMASCYLDKGATANNEKRYEVALEDYNNAQKHYALLAEQLPLKYGTKNILDALSGKVSIYFNRGFDFELAEDFTKALENYKLSVDVLDKQLDLSPETILYKENKVFLQGYIANAEYGLKNYQKAVDAQVSICQYYENLNPRNDSLVANSYGNMAWYYLFNQQFKEAEEKAEKGLELDPTQIWINTNLAMSYLLNRKKDKAFEIYNRQKNEIYLGTNQTFREIFLEDIKYISESGIEVPFKEEAEAEIKKE